MRKRLLAIIATVAMVVAMMPSMVFGATTVSNLTDLRTALASGGTVVLGDNISMGESDTTIEIPAGVTVTLDLNGKTLSQTKAATSPGYQVILNDGNLTIKDGVGTGKISYTDSGSGGEYISDTIYNRANLVIDGGTIENLSSATVASNGYPHAVDTYSGIRDTSTTINGGTIYCENYSAIRMFCVSATNKADLVINGGTIKGAIDMQNGTKVAALGSLKINDGDFDTTKNANNIRFANWGNGFPDNEFGITAVIEGGEFDGGITSQYVPTASNWNKKVVSGGVFPENKVDEYISDNADKATVTNPDGTKSTAVGTETIREVIENAPAGTSVVIDKTTAGADYGTPAGGVEVTNKTDNIIVVGGENITKDQSVVGETPTPPEEPGEETEQPEVNEGEESEAIPEPEDEVDTGDNMNVVIPFAIAALALAAMGTVVATRRRHN